MVAKIVRTNGEILFLDGRAVALCPVVNESPDENGKKNNLKVMVGDVNEGNKDNYIERFLDKGDKVYFMENGRTVDIYTGY